MGGTFNPPHIGHLLLAAEVRQELGYDRILFIPSNKPAHKEVDGGVTSAHRLAMVKLSLEGLPWASLEPCEIIRGGVSYSIDTVECVYKNYDLTGKPGLVIGDDLFQGFSTWKDADFLTRRADIIVAHRLYEEKLVFPYEHRYISNKILPLSSSEIRQRIREEKPWEPLVVPGVRDYIRKEGLYLPKEDI